MAKANSNKHVAASPIPFGYCHCGCGRKAPISDGRFVRKGQPYKFIRGHVLGAAKSSVTDSFAIQVTPVNVPDIYGSRFGKLTVLAYSFSRPSGGKARSYWACRCDCGNICVHAIAYLRKFSASTNGGCGECSKHDGIAKRRVSRKVHGMTGTPEYRIWRAMKGRCLRESDPNYHNYGGRGITICDSWRTSFPNFFADIGKKPSPRHSLDRIDNDGNYEPGNVRWATGKTQNNNKRPPTTCRSKPIRTIEFNGKALRLKDWARELDLSLNCLYERLKKHPVEVALTLKKYGTNSFHR